MPAEELVTLIETPPRCQTMIIGLSGWMDGGDVSTGTIDWLRRSLHARPVARIQPERFFIYNFPGSMEIAALFRPKTRIEEGLIRALEPPQNNFYVADDAGLLLFTGKEPNLAWSAFAACLFEMAHRCGITMIYFIGSVAGAVPHTRDPRMMCSVSDPQLKPLMEQSGVRFADYEGPASFSTLLNVEATKRGVLMANLVAEIPPYVQGMNPKSIELVSRKLMAIAGFQADLTELRELSVAWEEKLNEVLTGDDNEDLNEHIHRLEEDYDNDVFDTQMGDLKEWLEQRGIRLD